MMGFKRVCDNINDKLLVFLVESAIFCQETGVAFRLARLTDISAVENQPMMGFRDILFRNIFHQTFLCLKGIL